MSKERRNAIVLSGGGARGAYEVGVLLYLRGRFKKLFGRHLSFQVIAGTSVGALNGSFMAATADSLDQQAERLAAAWRGLHMEELMALKPLDLMRSVSLLFGKEPPSPRPGSYHYGGILDTTGLERFVLKTVPWRRIRKNLRQGYLDSLAVTTTHVGTGHSVVFLDSAGSIPGAWSHNPFVRHQRAAIGPRHALASAAIPLLFPAVKVGQAFYVDGGLRNNTPMSPAIRLGADRLLIISLRHESSKQEEIERAKDRERAYPEPLFLVGKALNSLLLDPTDYDLDRMRRINAILEAGCRAFGDAFEPAMAKELIALRGAPLRRLEAVHIQPSEDIGMLAADLMARGGPKLSSRITRSLIHRISRHEARFEADLLSYLLFDSEFARVLIDLGFADAKAHEEELLRVFSDG